MSIQLLHLYPDLMNLYGEYANVAALRRSLERQGAEVIVRTGTLYEDIDFSGADFLYMGAGTESAQLTALEDLRRYESAVRAALDRGAVVLATGNAMELFGRSITGPDGTAHAGLGLFPFRTAVSGTERIQGDCLAVGAATGQVAVGFVNKASQTTDVEHPLFRMEHGPGNNAGTAEDGVWEGSFYGTHLIGPLLMKNPHVNVYFTELLCRRAGLPYQAQDCPHEQRAYEVTLRALQERFQQQ